ncbi:MAG: HepT-like ribonuclease domain-containing protein [Coriobacteriia bacterium]|nr:HepT-like ribonuclease domain-containing protein [Coriobacteriia bacterium]
MNARRNPRARLEDILAAIDKILGRASGDRSAFMRDELLQVWVLYYLGVIGEAAACMDPPTTAAYPEVDWIALSGTRNHLVHGYFDIDLAVVWEVVERDLPPLRDQIVGIIDSMQGKDVHR